MEGEGKPYYTTVYYAYNTAQLWYLKMLVTTVWFQDVQTSVASGPMPRTPIRPVSLDSSMATMILDGEMWKRVPWDVVELSPFLARAIMQALSANHIARVKMSKEANLTFESLYTHFGILNSVGSLSQTLG